MRLMRKPGGFLAAIGLAAGLALAGHGTASATAACPAWSGSQPPSPQGSSAPEFFSVAEAGPCDVWMVGDDTDRTGTDQPLIDHWTGGSSWTVVPGPSLAESGSARLNSVSALSTTDIWAAGEITSSTSGPLPLMLHWDGTSWTEKTVPGGAGTALLSVEAVSASDVWAAGSSNTAAFMLHYDGTSWTQSPLPALTPPPGDSSIVTAIGSLDAISADDVWVAGTTFVSSGHSTPVALHWNGTAWLDQSPPPSAPAEDLGSVSASGPDDVWVAGAVRAGSASSPLLEHWDGRNWAVASLPASAGQPSSLDGVVSISPTSALAVGAYNQNSGSPQALALHWDGQKWTQIPGNVPGTVTSLFAVAAGPAGIWAAGQSSGPGNPGSVAASFFGTVPNVVGDSQAAAAGALDSAGLSSTVTTVTNTGAGCNSVTDGTILATTPPAGTFATPPVAMTLCKFPHPVHAPDVTGLSDASARSAITSAGLRVGTVTLTPNCTVAAGTVLSQDPAPGTQVPPGSSVSLNEATRSGGTVQITPHFCTH